MIAIGTRWFDLNSAVNNWQVKANSYLKQHGGGRLIVETGERAIHFVVYTKEPIDLAVIQDWLRGSPGLDRLEFYEYTDVPEDMSDEDLIGQVIERIGEFLVRKVQGG